MKRERTGTPDAVQVFHHEMRSDDPRRMLLNLPPLVAEKVSFQQRGTRGSGKGTPQAAAGQEYVIDARVDAVVSQCFWCASADLAKRKDRVVVSDLPMHGVPTKVRCDLAIYHCRHCERDFRTRMVGVELARRMTTRLRKALEDRVLKRRYDHLAADFGVSEGTIRSVADELVDAIERTWKVRTPRVLGIDDIWINKKARTVFVDSETGDVLHIADSKKKVDVARGLALFSPSTVEAVTMDMDEAYRPIIRAMFPKAKIVFDKFHVSKRANDMMDGIRIACQHFYVPRSQTIGREWRRTFNSRMRNLPPRRDDAFNDNYLPDIRILLEAYHLKEDFLCLLDGNSSELAVASYQEWRHRVVDWLDDLANHQVPDKTADAIRQSVIVFLKLIDSEIHATFAGLDEGLTNARIESANGWIRMVEGVRQGYSYDMLKARVLYGRITPSTDLFECDLCRQRFSEPQRASLPIGGSWNAQDPSHALVEDYCDDCSERYVSQMMATPEGELTPAPDWLADIVSQPIRARNRVQKRKQENRAN